MIESTCNCQVCQDMCKESTCLPTPQEARQLIKQGYADRLAIYKFLPDPENMQYIGPAPKGYNLTDPLYTSRGRACGFSNENGCELHVLGLKPLEGRLAHHDLPWLPIRQYVCSHWKGKQFYSVLHAFNNARSK